MICGNKYEYNSADEGAVIYANHVNVSISQTNITENTANIRGSLYMRSGSLLLSDEVTFKNNNSSLYVHNCQVEFKGPVAFMNNVGDSGGAITAILSQISFDSTSVITIHNNTATNGGGISLVQSNLYVYHSIELTDNRATDFGGGIHGYHSVIEFKPEQTQKSVVRMNTASNGGAFYAIASTLAISNTFMDVSSNTARVNGGAMYLEDNCNIYIEKLISEYRVTQNVGLNFTNNSAEKGGAIYVADKTTDPVLCQGSANTEKLLYQTECFIQTLALYQLEKYDKNTNLMNTLFTKNTAHQSGSDIYGGLLDRCTMNRNAEIANYFPKNYTNGFDYVKATTQIEQLASNCVHYEPECKCKHYTDPSCFVNSISRSDVKGLISSDAVQVEFCLNNEISPNYSHPGVSVKKGESFIVSLVAVDQVGNPLNATIITTFQSRSEHGQLKEGQVERQVRNQCTKLVYNVYSQDDTAQIHVHADGPCSDNGVSRKTLNITFLPCTCPVGFEPSSASGPSGINCICECDQTLKDNQITSCYTENEIILVETNIWIGLRNYCNTSSNKTEVYTHDCPFDYCVEKPVNISLTSQDSIDEQCAYNRTGILCGKCQEGLSLVFGSSRCKECSNAYLSLLIPFALADIVLVVFILLLNMTVATGTIYGLIFYANILTANHSLFLSPSTSDYNFLTVFISWLNLDLGIETCFYDRMDSYAKFLLQLAFPVYVFVIIGTIIVLCEVSDKFARLLGNRNLVAVLCTLILLSYSKLIRTIITALQFTNIDYPHSPYWLYDANVPYFSLSHIPRLIAAFIIIIFGAVYTVLLLFGQWFPRCSRRRFMGWAKNTKYNAFIEAYHAPFTPRHRYWLGLLMLAQIICNIVAAMTTDLIPILLVGCITLALILLKLLNNWIYKNRLQDSLETLFLINIVILAIGTIFIREASIDQLITHHTKETNAYQRALTNISMIISFILFLIILGYHFYRYILNGTHFYEKLTQLWARIIQHLKHMIQVCRHREYDLLSLDNDHYNEDEPESEMEQPYTDENNMNSNDVPSVYNPPVIVPAVRYDQLREPDLDIIDPITTDDYRQVNQHPAPRPQKVPTTTIIDFV